MLSGCSVTDALIVGMRVEETYKKANRSKSQEINRIEHKRSAMRPFRSQIEHELSELYNKRDTMSLEEFEGKKTTLKAFILLIDELNNEYSIHRYILDGTEYKK